MTSGSSQGLFVIIAVVIFGIFVLISYLLFGDKMKTSLASIFDTSIEQSLENLTGETGIKIKDQEETETSIFSQLRKGENGESDIWVRYDKVGDNELTLKYSGETRESVTDSGSGNTSMKGTLTIPSSVNGRKVTSISENSFFWAEFDGEFYAPSVENINKLAFMHSKFIGQLNIPNLKNVEESAFKQSKFSGEFNLTSIEHLGDYAFQDSKFQGNFLSDSILTIGVGSFTNSNFSGDFTSDSIISIEYNSFYNSSFTGNFHSKSIKSIGSFSFTNSNFKGEFIANSVENIESYAFSNSNFEKVDANNLKTLSNTGLRMKGGKFYSK